MRKNTIKSILCLALLGFMVAHLHAQPHGQGAAEEKAPVDKMHPKAPEETSSVTQHSATIGAAEINYTATAGTIVLKEEEGKAKASIFYMAYVKDGETDKSDRPLTFSFNGGPGSSSVWLHLGVLGPRRVLTDEIGHAPAPPYQLVNNDFSLLDKTDLVFIDPVNTGYSRAAPGEEAKQFFGVDEDIEAVGEFIRRYVTREKRWASPKFLIGESYGTTRAAGLSGFLQDRQGMYLNGIMLVSSVLDFQTLRFNPGNDLPYILFLPTYTATAWYHKKLAADLQADLRAALDQAEAFALGEYATALMKGASLPEAEKRQIAQKLARFTGLSRQYVESCHLRIGIFRFTKELLRERRRTVGRLDSRFLGIDRDEAGEYTEYDPSYATIQGSYTATLNHYLRDELHFESDLPYEILSNRVRPWNFGDYSNRYVNVAETLRGAISKNPYLKVFVANGYYDLATPYFATQYTFNHLGLDPSLAANISMGYYQSGHMMYIHRPSLKRLKSDLAAFIDAASPK